MSYVFKFAATAAEFDGLRRLNHRVFAAEVGQHAPRADGLLADSREAHSRFVIALAGAEVVGMVAIHDQPPFSLEKRLADPAVLDALPGRKLEVRLLAIHPAHRGTMVFAGLLVTMVERALAEGYEVLLASGIVERLPIYERFGFRALGPAVPEGRANFVPIALRLADLPPPVLAGLTRWRRRQC